MRPKIAIFGATSFIAKNLIVDLSEFYDVYGFARNIEDPILRDNCKNVHYLDINNDESISKASIEIQKIDPEYAFNCISIVTAKNDLSLLDSMIDVNIKSVKVIYELLKNVTNLKLVVQFGSLEEYGNIAAPFYEEQKENPNTPYSVTKLTSTQLSMLLFHTFNYPVTVLRLSNLFGKFQNEVKLLPYLKTNLIANNNVRVSGSKSKRDYISINVFIDIIKDVLKNYQNFIGEVVNISTNQSIELKKVIEFMLETTKSSSRVEYSNELIRKNEIEDMKASNAKLKRLVRKDYNFSYKEMLDEYINKG